MPKAKRKARGRGTRAKLQRAAKRMTRKKNGQFKGKKGGKKRR